jgi:dihydroxyacetone kinase-like predicted kinase
VQPGPQADLTEDGPAYEVMFLLDAPDAAIAPLRATLAGLGDSLVVVGGEGLWNVHVHVDDVGAAIEAGIEAGRPHRVKVTHFVEQGSRHAETASSRTGRAVVAVAAGPGLRALFEEAGALVVEGRPTTTDLATAIVGTGAAEVIVLPNDATTLRSAEVAARAVEQDHGLRVAVIPTVAQVQGMAALAVHDPGTGFGKDVTEMTATARHARHGAVTLADRRALTLAGPCEPGDALGVIDGEFVRVGGALEEVAVDVLSRLVGGGGEMVTLVSGYDDADGALAAAATRWVEEHHPTVDVVTYRGGQVRYPLLVAVE